MACPDECPDGYPDRLTMRSANILFVRPVDKKVKPMDEGEAGEDPTGGGRPTRTAIGKRERPPQESAPAGGGAGPHESG